MEEKFVLELSKDEVLMLQELADTRCLESEYQWMFDIAEGLEKKAKAAYSKPRMSHEDFEKAAEEEYTRWNNMPDAVPGIGFHMSSAKRAELRFYYDVEESGGEADDVE